MNFLKDLFGLAKEKKGDFEGSIADHTKAIELKPDLAAAYNNRGNAKRAKGDLNGAIAGRRTAVSASGIVSQHARCGTSFHHC